MNNLTPNLNDLISTATKYRNSVLLHKTEAKDARYISHKILPIWQMTNCLANSMYDYEPYHKAAIHHEIVASKYNDVLTTVNDMIDTLKSRTLNTTTNRDKLYKKITANINLLKDGNYYKRYSKLLHLAIDKDCQNHVRDMEGNDSNSLAKEYINAYKKHPLYNKMQKMMRQVSKYPDAASHSTTVASVTVLPIATMRRIYKECCNDLLNKNVMQSDPKFHDMLILRLQRHPKTYEMQQMANS